MIIVEFHKLNRYRRFNYHAFPQFKRLGRVKFQTKVNTYEEARLLKWRGRLHGYRAYAFDERFNRSHSYRKQYFKAHPQEEYRCVYCGRWLPKNAITIDHVIPINAVAVSRVSRFIVNQKGLNGINDIRNLVPACYECNRRKGFRNNVFWHLRAYLGQFTVWWVFVWFIRILIVIGLICLIYVAFK